MKYLFLMASFCISIGAKAQYASDCGVIPELNKQILEILKPYKGKKIGRGECWDAAKLALDKVNAEWDGLYVFGREIDPKKECVQPGDIIQFENVMVETRSETGILKESYTHHTAIVNSLKSPGAFELFHQNTGYTGRKMGFADFDLKNVTKGKIKIYRPVPKS